MSYSGGPIVPIFGASKRLTVATGEVSVRP
jgi:hypothetical protein